MIAAAGFVSSLVTMISSALGFVAMFAFTVVLAPLGGVIFLFYAARGLFDETEFHRVQDGPANAQPV